MSIISIHAANEYMPDMYAPQEIYDQMYIEEPASKPAQPMQLPQRPSQPYSQPSSSREYHKNDYKFLIFECNGGVFRPADTILQKIYGHNWPSMQTKLSFSFLPNMLCGWIGLDYAAKSGKSIGGKQKTKMHIFPLSFGLRIIQPITTDPHIFSFTAGIGGQACFVRIFNDSTAVARKTSKVAPAGVIDVGMYVHPCRYATININLNYNFGKINCSSSCTNQNVVSFPVKISGLGIHAGIGFAY